MASRSPRLARSRAVSRLSHGVGACGGPGAWSSPRGGAALGAARGAPLLHSGDFLPGRRPVPTINESQGAARGPAPAAPHGDPAPRGPPDGDPDFGGDSRPPPRNAARAHVWLPQGGGGASAGPLQVGRLPAPRPAPRGPRCSRTPRARRWDPPLPPACVSVTGRPRAFPSSPPAAPAPRVHLPRTAPAPLHHVPRPPRVPRPARRRNCGSGAHRKWRGGAARAEGGGRRGDGGRGRRAPHSLRPDAGPAAQARSAAGAAGGDAGAASATSR